MDKKALILVVDDYAEYRELLASILEQHGFETISAQSGREAIELAMKCRPALILMDINMPGLNGYDATRAIHADRRTRETPVVAVSADCSDYGFELLARKAGFVGFLAKPWKLEALFAMVRKVLIGHVERTSAA